MEIETITILAGRVGEARTALDKLVRKAARYGNPDISYDVGEAYSVEEKVTDWDGRKRTVTKWYSDVTFSGEAPRFGDYEFLAHIEIVPGGAIVDVVPGKEVSPEYRHAQGTCDHCHTNRARKDVYVVQNVETGEQIQVGRTCLRDALGIDDPNKVVNRFRWMKELRELDRDEYRSWSWEQSLVGMLSLASTCVRLFGWCSKGQAMYDENLTATYDYVDLALQSKANVSQYEKELWQKIHDARQDEDEAQAEAVVNWVRSLEDVSSDYLHNLTVLFQGDILTDRKRMGMVISAVSGYHRAMETELRLTKEREAAGNSTHVGEVKERLRGVEVVLKDQRVIGSNMYGDIVLIKFVDMANNLYSWFTSQGTGAEIGETLTIDGTVKDHKEYKGVKETVLTRVKL